MAVMPVAVGTPMHNPVIAGFIVTGIVANWTLQPLNPAV